VRRGRHVIARAPSATVCDVPDPEGKLSPEEGDIFVKWLERYWLTRDCPFHGHTRWEIGDMVQLTPYAAGTLVVNAPVYPVIVVTCTQCGYTVLVNAKLSGVLPVFPAAPPDSVNPQQGS
jgi:predicted nucleic-acid-binding Zn-ribbon protein